ncbi:putative transcription factor interactor and regulator CCHC(Zn) family [Helianthus anomalus]
MKRNSQNNYTQYTNCCDVGPSTSRSRSSSSSSYSYDTLRFVEQRSCFKCDEYRHIVRSCPYVTKGKEKVDAPHCNSYLKDLFQKKKKKKNRTLVLLNNG